jgi:hypothetical protein
MNTQQNSEKNFEENAKERVMIEGFADHSDARKAGCESGLAH